MKASKRQSIFYFLGNIPEHALHALPLYQKLGGTFVVLSKDAENKLRSYGIKDVLRLQELPKTHLKLGVRTKKTVSYLENNADIVIFYEIFGFSKLNTLKSPTKLFLTHGNMLKDYMSSYPKRLKWLQDYDYMAGLGPHMKQQFIEKNNIPAEKILDIGIARTDEVLAGKTSKNKSSLEALTAAGCKSNQTIVSYIPTYWGDSSVYDTGLALLENLSEDFFAIVRPHPQTKDSLLQKYIQLAERKSNVLYAPEGSNLSLLDTLALSDVIIGDVSSVMLESILLDKPIVFAYGAGRHRQSDNNYDSISEVLERSQKISYENAGQIDEILKKAMKNSVDNKAWETVKKRMFYSYNGGSVKHIADTLLALKKD